MRPRLTPMPEGWLRRAPREIETRARERPVGGVQFFADEFDVVPGATRDEDERRAAAAALYGPPADPVLKR